MPQSNPYQMPHQYIDRKTGEVKTEILFKDPVVNFLYSSVKENAGFCFDMLLSGRSTALLSYFNFDFSFNQSKKRAKEFIRDLGIDMTECIIPEKRFFTARQVFERQIQYWNCRPMPEQMSRQRISNSPSDYKVLHFKIPIRDKCLKNDDGFEGTVEVEKKDEYNEGCGENGIVVSPSDSKVLVGTLSPDEPLFVKDKFFQYRELLGKEKWLQRFDSGDFAIFRLTPDEYHYNHTPVSGKVADIYEINGAYHACNPGAVVREVTPYSKNGRVVTVFDTDCPGGSRVGNVAMVEITAMMIGIIEQCYSDHQYDDPQDLSPGVFVRKGQPKSLFRPGSSTVILLFEPGKISFARDIVDNMHRVDGQSRFTKWFGSPLLETAVRVRDGIATTQQPHDWRRQ